MKHSDWLTNKSVDDFLFDPESSDTAEDRAGLAELRNICNRELTSPESLWQLKAELKDFTTARSTSKRVCNVIEEVREQLGEIADDLRFERSARGRFVLFCNGYVQELYKTIRTHSKFANALVGAHADREAVVVTGEVPDEAALDELGAIIAASSPGVEVIWKVTVASYSDDEET